MDGYRLIMSNEKEPKAKPKPQKPQAPLDQFPKFITFKKLKIPEVEYANEPSSTMQQNLHNPPQMHASSNKLYIDTLPLKPSSYHHYSPRGAPHGARYYEPLPMRAPPDYESWSYLQGASRPNHIYKATSFDGNNISLANPPQPRFRNMYNYNSYNSPMHTLSAQNLGMNRPINPFHNTYIMTTESPASSRRNRNQEVEERVSANNSIKSNRSHTSAQGNPEFIQSRELEVEVVEKFQDENGVTYKVVKPVGERSRIVYTRPIQQNFVIVENKPTPPPPQTPPPQTQLPQTQPPSQTPPPPTPPTEPIEPSLVLEDQNKDKEESPEPLAEQEAVENVEEEQSDFLESGEMSPTISTSTQTRRRKRVTYKDTKGSKMRQELTKPEKEFVKTNLLLNPDTSLIEI